MSSKLTLGPHPSTDCSAPQRFKPRTAGWEAQTLHLCYAVPPAGPLMIQKLQWESVGRFKTSKEKTPKKRLNTKKILDLKHRPSTTTRTTPTTTRTTSSKESVEFQKKTSLLWNLVLTIILFCHICVKFRGRGEEWETVGNLVLIKVLLPKDSRRMTHGPFDQQAEL